jgi:hypothetical protein
MNIRVPQWHSAKSRANADLYRAAVFLTSQVVWLPFDSDGHDRSRDRRDGPIAVIDHQVRSLPKDKAKRREAWNPLALLRQGGEWSQPSIKMFPKSLFSHTNPRRLGFVDLPEDPRRDRKA